MPLSVVSGRTADLNVTITNPRDDPVVVAYLEIGGRVVEERVLATDARRGSRFDTTWRLAVPSAATEPGVVPVSSDSGSVRVGYAAGPSEKRALAGAIVQQRLPYRVAGDQLDLLYGPVAYVSPPALFERQFRPVTGTAGIDVQVTTNR